MRRESLVELLLWVSWLEMNRLRMDLDDWLEMYRLRMYLGNRLREMYLSDLPNRSDIVHGMIYSWLEALNTADDNNNHEENWPDDEEEDNCRDSSSLVASTIIICGITNTT